MMTMKKKLYIETSVWNQLEHTDRPEWRDTAERFLKAMGAGHYELYISKIVIDEILETTNIRSGYDHVIDITTPHRFLVDAE